MHWQWFGFATLCLFLGVFNQTLGHWWMWFFFGPVALVAVTFAIFSIVDQGSRPPKGGAEPEA